MLFYSLNFQFFRLNFQEKYDQFKADMQLLHDKTTLLRQTIAQNLSAEARQADMDLANIGKDKTLSVQQKKEKFEAYLASNNWF